MTIDRAERWLLVAGLVASLALAEIGARVFTGLRGPGRKQVDVTHVRPRGSRFAENEALGYALTPGFRTNGREHNDQGYRGPNTTIDKSPETLRVVIVGASTVYGELVTEPESSARQIETLLRAALPGRVVEVVNAGVPGWNSAETLISLRERVFPLDPDAIVILDGRNELFPQLFDRYRDDYSHFRVSAAEVRERQSYFERIFRVSHLAMLWIKGSGHLGYSDRLEHFLYASIRFENRPSVEGILRNADDSRRTRGFHTNLSRAVERARERGVDIVLSTMPFWVEGYRSGIIYRDERLLPALARVMQRNNAVIVSVAAEQRVPLVDAASALSTSEWLIDDCHFNPAGERAFAGLVLEKLLPLLRARLSSAAGPG